MSQIMKKYRFAFEIEKTRQDKIYFESARQLTINISSRALLNRLFENKCIKSTYGQQLHKKKTVCDIKHQTSKIIKIYKLNKIFYIYKHTRNSM